MGTVRALSRLAGQRNGGDTALLALPIGIIATVILSLFFDKTVFKYYRDMKSEPVILIVVSIGVMFILYNVLKDHLLWCLLKHGRRSILKQDR